MKRIGKRQTKVASLLLSIVFVGLLVTPNVFAAASYDWTAQTSAGSRAWYDVASSSDGKYIAALGLDSSTGMGDIFTSSDYGKTWTDRSSAGTEIWINIAESADGSHIVAASIFGSVVTSSNFGASWTQHTVGAGGQDWDSLSSSSTGQYLVAGDYDNNIGGSGGIYISDNYGASWTEYSVGTGDQQWNTSAISASGKYVVMAARNESVIYTSDNYGISWVSHTASAAPQRWSDISSSSDGRYLAANVMNGNVYTSSDYGATWTERTIGSGGQYWTAIDSSASGQFVVATLSGVSGEIYISDNYGASWTEQASAGTNVWSSVAISSDGSRIVAGAGTYSVPISGYIYTADIVSPPDPSQPTSSGSTNPGVQNNLPKTPDTGYGVNYADPLTTLIGYGLAAATLAGFGLIIRRFARRYN